VWSAALSGRPVRPGQSPDGSLLIPLEKSRGGEDAPEFVIELVYFTRAERNGTIREMLVIISFTHQHFYAKVLAWYTNQRL
jgi:hypothetical protein